MTADTDGTLKFGLSEWSALGGIFITVLVSSIAATTYLTGQISTVRGQVQSHAETIYELKKDVEGVRSSVADMKSDMAVLKDRDERHDSKPPTQP